MYALLWMVLNVTYLRTSITEEINHFSLVRVDSYLIYTADESLLCR